MYHKDGTVDVKLLADLGYIADRLRNLEQKWDLTELKDLHRRIVLKFDDPPTSVLRLRETLAHTPTVPPGSPEQQEQEVLVNEVEKAPVVIVAAEQTPCVVVEECPAVSETVHCSEDASDCNEKNVWDAENVDEKVHKLDQLEDLVIAFYHTCGRRSSGCTVEQTGSGTARDDPDHSRARTKRTKKKHSIKKVVDQPSPSHQDRQQGQQPDSERTMNQGTDPDQDRDQLARVAPSTALSEPSGSVPCIDTRQPSQPLRSIHGDDGTNAPGTLDRESTLDDEEDTVTLTAETSSECCSQQTVVALAGAVPSHAPDRSETGVAGSDTTTDDDEEEDADTGGSGADANDEAEPGEPGTRRSTLEQDSSTASRRGSLGGEFETEQNRRLRRRLSELTNNFCTPKQFQQLCDNLDSITDNDLKLLIRELKRKIEFAERMNWLCLSSRPRGPPHRKTSLPKHTDVKKRFLETCDTTLSDEVKAALRLPAFDSYEWEDWDVIHLMQTMFVELNLLEKFNIPIVTLREWLYEVYKHYNDVPFHNYRHCFCVAQMVSIVLGGNLPHLVSGCATEAVSLCISCRFHSF
uniref:PDEase domain-containing protein n=1 Tax=Anopheles culicifacies TaxID=139723 RepID=A0A182MWY6_9DIPT